MKKILSISILICILLSNSYSTLLAQSSDVQICIDSGELDDFITEEMQKRHIPGLSASIVINDIIHWKRAYGYADIENNYCVTNESLFKIASISKTITATSLMMLYEQDLFDLHDPINNYLPFEIIHPDYPSIDITFHMLLTHSSSIIDNWNYFFYFQGDAPFSFQSFLEQYLVAGGDYYDRENNFGSWKPGTSYSYSNIAVALIGYLIETISNDSFTNYTKTKLFEPLNMNESGWYLKDVNISNIAMPYHWNGEDYEPYGHIGYVDVPAGDLRTSATQLIHFLSMIIKKGGYHGEKILDSSTVEMMLTPQLSFMNNIGLIWWKRSIGDRIVWGHGGADFGCRANMRFDPETNIGVVVLINGESDLSSITKRLFEYAESIDVNTHPETPIIYGPSIGKTNVAKYYTFTSEDPNNNPVFYFVDWDDNNTIGWIEEYPSRGKVTLCHTYSEQGTYLIRVKSKDIYDAESDWGALEVTISKTKKYNLIQLWFQQVKGRFPIFRYLL